MLSGRVLGAGIEAVAFDFDGTLADTRPAILATMTQTFAALAVPGLADAAIVSMMGLRLSHVLRAGGVPEAALDEAVAHYRARFPDNAREVVLFDGVVACLSELAEAGIAACVVSSRGRHSLGALLEQLGVHAHFAHVLGEEDAARPKPAPDLVLALGRTLDVDPRRMLVVGDTTFDIEMGVAAGARTCGVSYGSHGAEQLRAAGAGFVVDSLGGLAARLHASPLAATSNPS